MNTANMTPVDWAKRPLQKYADFSGRAPRAEFWWYCLGIVVAAIVAMIIESILGLGSVFLMYGPITLLLLLGTFIPSLAAQVRRLHDTNRSGLWLLAFYVPYVAMLATMPNPTDPNAVTAPDMGSAALTGLLGLVVLVLAIVLLIFLVLPGTKGDNRFGPDPYAGSTDAPATA